MSYKLEPRLLREIPTTSDMQIILLNGGKQEELKSLLMKVKEESEEAGLKLSTQNTKTVVSSPITSWQMDGEKWEQWQILLSCSPKSLLMVTAAMKLKVACFLEEKP